MGEVAITISGVLEACSSDLQSMPGHYRTYLQSLDLAIRCPPIVDGEDLERVYHTCTKTACERFVTYLAFHRHLIARTAKNRSPELSSFGRSRYFGYFGETDRNERRLHNNFLSTNLNGPPYDVSLNKFYEKAGTEVKTWLLSPELDGKSVACGYVKDGTLFNALIEDEDYVRLYDRMETLFHRLTDPNLLPVRDFLDAVFEIQFWFIVIMPCDRGSRAIMDLFRFVMLAYYNRRQPDPDRWLPLAPNRLDVYPDLYALLLCDTVDEFIAMSFSDLYCVDYTAYCND